MDSYHPSPADWSADLTSLCPAFDADPCFALDASTEQMIANLYPFPPLYKGDDLGFAALHDDHRLATLAPPQPALRRARSSGVLPSSSYSGSSMSAFPMTTPSSSWSGSPNSDLSLHTPQEGCKVQNYFGAPASPVSPVYGGYHEFPQQAQPVASTSYLPPSEPMVPSASVEEVNAFLNDMTTLLGKDAMASISPSQVQPSLSPVSAASAPTPTHAPQPRKPSFEVSGVLLDEDDLAALNSPNAPSTSTYRQSYLEPALLPPPPQQAYGYYPDPAAAYSHAPYPPRTPTRNTLSVQRPRQLRRPSSIELMQALPRSAPVYHPNQPYPQDLVGMGVYLPAEHTSPTPAPQQAHAGPQRTIRKMASMPNTRVSRKPAGPPPPMPAVPKAVKKQPSGSCFINFSASDSKVLLSGVAPSGSSKRKRDTKVADDKEDKKAKA